MQSLLREGALVPNAATEASDVDVSERSPFADMKDNLAPISDKAIKAYLFDLVKNSTNPKIESIEVKKSLGQASVGQALLCSVKCDGLDEQPLLNNDAVIYP